MRVVCPRCEGDPVAADGSICSTCDGECMIENDCEDQGYSLISDGCLKNECAIWFPGAQKPERPKLVKVKRNGGEFWVCPSCDASYGPTT